MNQSEVKVWGIANAEAGRQKLTTCFKSNLASLECVARDGAARVRTNVSGGVRTARRTCRSSLEVTSRKVGHCSRVAAVLLVVHRPLLFRRVDLLEVSDTGVLSSTFSGLHKVRDCDRHEDPDDQDDDHNFDERESSISLHVSLHSWCVSSQV